MRMLAYNPELELAESYVATHHIYCLKNPENGEIFYIGKTTKDLKIRLSGHISDTGATSAKGKYLKDLFEKGFKPIIEDIEIIYTTCYIDTIKSSEREYYWIKYYKEIGAPLTNIQGTEEDARSLEYHTYLSCIKAGEIKWNYYYCGKTNNGIDVFDEERIKEDGFNFPNILPHYTPIIEEDTFKERITYEKYYDDEDPDYIRSSQEEI